MPGTHELHVKFSDRVKAVDCRKKLRTIMKRKGLTKAESTSVGAMGVMPAGV